MIYLAVFYIIFSSIGLAHNPYLGLNGWPEIHPPINFRPLPPEPGSDLPPYHIPALQSPIDIRTWEAAKKRLPPLIFKDLVNDKVLVNMRNTGSTIEFDMADESVMKPLLMGGPLSNHGVFQFDNLHIHWGYRDLGGGEHKINGRRFAVEGHCVHFNLKYGTIEEAMKHSDGLCVVAFFGMATPEDNPKIARLISLIPQITLPETSVTLTAKESLDWFADLGQPRCYFTYPGSLTTPEYTENVFWIIYPEPMRIGSRQVEAFRNILSSDYERLRENIRPIQPFNHRPLIYAV